MPAITTLQGGNQIDTVGEDTSNSSAVSVVSGAANTKGASWTEIIASTPITAEAVIVTIMSASGATGLDFLADIAIGGSGSEKLLIENLLMSAKGSETARMFFFNRRIPAGSRLSAKVQCSTATTTIKISIQLIGGGWRMSPGFSRCMTYGANTADSGGTGVDPGGTANTKGGWTEIVASTTNPIKQLLVAVGDRANNVMSAAFFLLDIGVGAATAEKIVIPNLPIMAGTNDDTLEPSVYGPFPVNIPAGSRLAANCQCSITDATDRLIDVVLYGCD